MKALIYLILAICLALFTSCNVVKDIFRSKKKTERTEYSAIDSSQRTIKNDSSFSLIKKDTDYLRRTDIFLSGPSSSITINPDGSMRIDGDASITHTDSGSSTETSETGSVSSESVDASSSERSGKKEAKEEKETGKRIKRKSFPTVWAGIFIFVLVAVGVFWFFYPRIRKFLKPTGL